MNGSVADIELRRAAFQWLNRVTEGGELPVSWNALQRGFRFNGEVVTLIGAKGIWKPERAELPISITTSPPHPSRPVAPYDDEITDEGLLRYRYEGTDSRGYRNVWLRECWSRQIPLIYLHGIAQGIYVAAWPVMVFEDRPDDLSVLVEMLDPRRIRPDLSVDVADEAERRFYSRITSQRLEQAGFRSAVMRAYGERCAVCRLTHAELLDAAHIVPYAEHGPSVVANGLSLCKIHHAAYDHNILGVSPDAVLHLRQDMLDEIDGPMLRHGLQAVHRQELILPRRRADRPSPDFLERRWQQFMDA
jgi:putative restriction endonuclease